MKKLLLVLVMVSFLVGCSSLKMAHKESEFWSHDSQWATWSHAKFSIWGYNNPTPDVVEKAKAEGWWGVPVPYVPAE